MPTEPILTERTIDAGVANAGSASVGRVRIHCVSCGPAEGPLIIFLHGFPERWSTWRGLLPAFANAGYLAVAPDQRGFGASDRPAEVESYAVSRLAEDVVAIIDAYGRRDAYGHQQAHLVGHDFGGGIAWAVAMAHPERVAKLAILNSVHPVGFQRQMRKWSQISKSWYILFFQLPWLPEWILSRRNYLFLRRELAKGGLSKDVAEDLLEGVRPPGALHAAINWYRAGVREVAHHRFVPRKVAHETLVVWGDGDRYLDRDLATPPVDWVTSARVEHIPEAAHWVHHDAPSRVTELVLSHLH